MHIPYTPLPVGNYERMPLTLSLLRIPKLTVCAGQPHPQAECCGRSLGCRVEYIRLLEQALSQLGFDGAARHLEQESGVALEAPEIGRLRTAVLAGDFSEAVHLLGQLPLSDYEYRRAEFALLEQNFLEVRSDDVLACSRCCPSRRTPMADPCSMVAGCLVGWYPLLG